MIRHIIEKEVKEKGGNASEIALSPMGYRMFRKELQDMSLEAIGDIDSYLGLPVRVHKHQHDFAKVLVEQPEREGQTGEVVLQSDGNYVYIGAEVRGEMVVFAVPRVEVAAALMGLDSG